MQEKKNFNEEEQRGDVYFKDIIATVKLQPLSCEALFQKAEVTFEYFNAFYEVQLRSSAKKLSKALINSEELEDVLFENGIEGNREIIWQLYSLAQLNSNKGKLNMLSPEFQMLLKQITIFSTDLSKLERDYTIAQIEKDIQSLNLIARILLASRIIEGLDSKFVYEFQEDTLLTDIIMELENMLPFSDKEKVEDVYTKIKISPLDLQENLAWKIYTESATELEALLLFL